VVNLQVTLPPIEEDLDIPPQLIGEGDLLGGEIMAVCGDPVIDVCDSITDETNLFLCLIDGWGPQQNHGVVEDNTPWLNIVLSDFVPFGGSLDATDKVFSLCLPVIEALMALIVAIHDPCFSGGEDLTDELDPSR